MPSALQAPLLLPIAPDLPDSCSLRGWRRDRGGAGICRRGRGPASVPQVGSPCALPAGGLIMAGPLSPGCAWGLRRRCGDLCTGLPLAQTMASTSPCLPSPPSLGPALGSWAHRPVQLPSVASLGPSSHPKADCWQSCSRLQARAAFAFSFLQLRGRCPSLFHPQDGLGAWTHSHGVQEL